MTQELVILDTNAVIRFIIDDDTEKSKMVSILLNEKDCIVPLEVIAETVYNLAGKYDHSRQTIADEVKEFAAIKENLVAEEAVIRYGLNLYASSTLDFVDCLLDGYAKINGCSVFTFDEALKKQLKHKFYRA
jgi:predicted nucleic-acid-binding protein